MFVEIKYLNLLSPRLSKFKQTKRNVWNFRCPICGDSQKSKHKARGFVFENKGDLVYKCHNCGVSMSVSKLIETLDPMVYKEYRMEKFQSDKKPRLDTRKIERVISTTPKFKIDPLRKLTRIDDLNNSHPAKEYLLNRQLPTQALYYTEKFKEWTNSVKPDTFLDTDNDEGRIIIPFRTSEGDVFGYQGRSLHNSGIRYITILLQEDKPKVFGLDTINPNKPVFIVEGPFDSMFIDNCVAMAGADLSSASNFKTCVYVFDNEPRNESICKRIKKHIQQGHNVVIWPQNIKEKDINDMVLAGHNVKNMIESNVYSGLSAILKFNDWKK